MSWIDKELKKRSVDAPANVPRSARIATEATHMQALWERVVACNGALPEELQLRGDKPFPEPAPGVKFLAWMLAPNGAALGFTGDAIRYVWPHRSAKRSNNFWIRWDMDAGHPVLQQRVNFASPPVLRKAGLDESKLDHLVKCLVTGKQATLRSMRKKRLGFF